VYDFCDGNAMAPSREYQHVYSDWRQPNRNVFAMLSKADSIHSPQPIYSFGKISIFCPFLHNYLSTYPEIMY
jgi:hypothetical protein